VSSCLLGHQVRFDGGHKRQAFLLDDLAGFVDLVPVCPEVEMGLGVPRETLRLVLPAGGDSPTDAGARPSPRPRLVGNQTGSDHTDGMNAWAAARIAELGELDLDGYVLKKDSPSCGLERVRLYREGAPSSVQPSRTGTGLYAQALSTALPGLPLTEEGWLMDAGRRESFLARLFTHHRLRTVLDAGSSSRAGETSSARHALVKIHAAHKFLYMAHSPRGQHALGRVVARVAELPTQEIAPTYIGLAMGLLGHVATRGKHANVLQHILGFFKNVLAPPEKTEILALIEEFRSGLHTLAVPLALLTHHLRRHEQGGWLSEQVYFDPFPKQLGFRMDGAR
jgi:uncharacterized protein YbgA (DUF1722 family)/uncharacterized protein YbbK (DUF523 family)